MNKAMAPAEDAPAPAAQATNMGKGTEDESAALPVPEPAQPPPEAKPAARPPRPLLPVPFGRAADLNPDQKGELSLRFCASWLLTFPTEARAQFLERARRRAALALGGHALTRRLRAALARAQKARQALAQG